MGKLRVSPGVGGGHWSISWHAEGTLEIIVIERKRIAIFIIKTLSE